MKSILLHVFFENTYREYCLTGKSEDTIVCELHSSREGVYEDYILQIEKLQGQWHIKNGSGAKLSVAGVEVNEKQLLSEEWINVTFPDGEVQATIYVNQADENNISLSKYFCSKDKHITIGSSDEDTIIYNSPGISSSHITIDFDGDCAHIDCKEEESVVFLNGEKVRNAMLNFGDVINILGLKLVYMDSILAVNNPTGFVKCNLQPFKKGASVDESEGQGINGNSYDDQSYFQRSPRIVKRVEEGEWEIDSPPQPNYHKEQPMMLSLGPAFTMGMGMVFSLMFTIYSSRNNPQMVIPGIAMTATMLAGTIVWPIISRMYHSFSVKRDEKRRIKRYRQYMQKEYKRLEEQLDKNRKVLLGTYPEPTICINRVANKDRRIWERMPSNKDFLDVRLGKGTRASTINLKLPKERFSMVDDPLLEELKEIGGDYRLVSNVPICLPLLENKMVGMIGERKMIIEAVMSIIVQLAALHSYDEVKLVCICRHKESGPWDWVRQLPHIWGPEKSIRFFASSRDEVREVLQYLHEVLKEREQVKKDYLQQQAMQLPYFIIFIEAPELVENEPVMHYLTNSDESLGVSTVFIYEKLSLLPKECNAFVQFSDIECSVYHRDSPEGDMVAFTPDPILDQDLDAFSRTLAATKVKEVASALSLPSMLTFMEMYKAGRIEQLDIKRRWRENLSYRSLEAPLGVKAGNVQFYLNIHEKYHGPHGLIAGMTGSGKSEFIQSYILSMAVNYHPNDVSFILIDYKGGGMANCFAGLPHIAGMITNLGGNQIHRSLISLESELKRRQRIFAEHGVNHIDKYQQLYKEYKAKEPLPHLVIISDEFAELKSQQPEFMAELVSTARIGRSLGVHLILATQKPSGVVDDQIWSNTSFRICLKVLDKSDSSEMLKRPEAANIVQPGRCYVQVGNNEIFELIQSGWSGAPYIPTDKIESKEDKQLELIDGCGRPLKTAACETKAAKSDETQMSAIVDYISGLAEKEGITPLKLWMDTLAEVIYLDDIEAGNGGGWDGEGWQPVDRWMCPVVGMIDDPKGQKQYPLEVNIGNEGHIALYGAPGTGKTTFLQTLIYSLVKSYSPEAVNIYIADFGGRTMGYYNELPHVGGVVFSDNEEGIGKLFKLFSKELESRKKQFSEYGVGNLKAYMETDGAKVPVLLLVLDGYEAFNELYPDFEQTVITISREGGNYGIYLVLTASNTNSIKHRVTQNIKSMYTLQLNDKYDYVGLVGQTNGLEPEVVPGRGLVKIGTVLEYQTAVAFEAASEADRVYRLRTLFREMGSKWKGHRAKSIPFVPEELTLDLMLENEEIASEVGKGLLPVGYDLGEAEAASLDLADKITYGVLGFDKTGKTNLIKAIHRMIKAHSGWKVYIVDGDQRELQRFSLKYGADGYVCSADEFDAFIVPLVEEMKTRHKALKAFREKESNEISEREYMSRYERIFVLIDNFDSFYDMISEDALNLMENILRGGAGLGVSFIVSGEPVRISRYTGSTLHSQIFNGTSGILLGGRLDSQNIFNPNMSYQQRIAQLDAGTGYLIDKGNYRIIKTPLA